VAAVLLLLAQQAVQALVVQVVAETERLALLERQIEAAVAVVVVQLVVLVRPVVQVS
jgi:hypothetical protein